MNKNIIKCTMAILLGIILFLVFDYFNLSTILSLTFDKGKLDIIELKYKEQIKREKLHKINTREDIYGFWKDDEYGLDNRYEALIDNDSIIVYGYLEGNKNVYWVGNFNLQNDFEVNSNSQISSTNYKSISKYIELAAQTQTKEFTYENGVISFISQFNDTYHEVHLKRYDPHDDRIRMIKYNVDRVGHYDRNNNKKIELQNYVIEYPEYFDTEEENSFGNIPNSFVYNIDSGLVEKKLIVLSPSATRSHAEFYVNESKNNKINDIYELYEVMQNESVNLNLATNRLISFTFNSESNSIMIIFSTKYVDTYDDSKVICGLAFENWMIKNETNELIIVGVAYTNDDTSDYDYIGDYEKAIQGMKRK